MIENPNIQEKISNSRLITERNKSKLANARTIDRHSRYVS